MKKVIVIMTTLIFFITNAYGYVEKKNLSKWDKKRPVRKTTQLIVLHTTEAENGSSLNSVTKQGTCNYLVETDGTVYNIIQHNKVAKHAGRSMWNGMMNVSNFSIGIEVVGDHDEKPTTAQLASLKTLLAKLQKLYRLSDKAVVTHCMVAYGTPNKWFSKKHRGRKRCAMLFTTQDIRMKMGLDNVFTIDPDVQAKRLINADEFLAKLIYVTHGYTKKEETKPIKTLPQPEVDDDFEGFREIGSEGVYSFAGEEYDAATTIYFLTDGKIKTGKELQQAEFTSLSKGTKVLVGYVYGGKINQHRSAYNIVGADWDLPSTYYRFPDGKIYTGDDVDNFKLPIGTIVLFRK